MNSEPRVPDSTMPLTSYVVQLTALRTAFPGYSFSLIPAGIGGKDCYEAVAKNGTGSRVYCLISHDAREIWRELKAAA